MIDFLRYFDIKKDIIEIGNSFQTFTGKERDSETGFSYFGARYYDSDLMTGWLSVDPMADKYPSLSPYAYCVWNPVRLVDQDGEELVLNDDWVKITGTHEYIWMEDVKNRENTPDGYEYVGANDDDILDDLNIPIEFDTKKTYSKGFNQELSWNCLRIGVSSVNYSEATIRAKPRIEYDKNLNKVFKGVEIYAYMTQKSKSIDQKTNSMIYHGGLQVYGNTGLVETAGLKPPTSAIYETGTYPQNASLFIPAIYFRNGNFLMQAKIIAGCSENGGQNETINYSWPLLKNSTIYKK